MTSVLWPGPWTLEQFDKLFQETEFGVWYRNTVLVSVVWTFDADSTLNPPSLGTGGAVLVTSSQRLYVLGGRP